MIVWLTGLSGSGKTTLARSLQQNLVGAGRRVVLFDGDEIRRSLSAGLGFTPSDRSENVRRVAAAARAAATMGADVIVALVSPHRADRDSARAAAVAEGIAFLEVHVAAPLETCERRDPKGLYKKARAGELSNVTGIDAIYEAPLRPELILHTHLEPPAQSAKRLCALIDERREG